VGDDLCEVAADAATTPCAHPSNEKNKDLECTFESNSTQSITEQQDSIGTSFGTLPSHQARITPGTRPSPIRVRHLT
jgi:hypothetical protein